MVKLHKLKGPVSLYRLLKYRIARIPGNFTFAEFYYRRPKRKDVNFKHNTNGAGLQARAEGRAARTLRDQIDERVDELMALVFDKGGLPLLSRNRHHDHRDWDAFWNDVLASRPRVSAIRAAGAATGTPGPASGVLLPEHLRHLAEGLAAARARALRYPGHADGNRGS
ncbi:hypothetical protein DL764_006222 [Monosporascus ibericus]|uniref:Uncharacterized protein n=1 Tax=Monosporascus ibericus TaxID=155417 RepID=A0A4Q4T5C9_9PEZI|nr:hypothetical protein DL764_006222 [Monosporascus ibericus]